MTDIPEDIDKFLSGIPITQLPEFCAATHCPYSTKSYLGDASQYWSGAILIRCFADIPFYVFEDDPQKGFQERMRNQVPYLDLCDYHLDIFVPSGTYKYSTSPPKDNKWMCISD